jgi:hypothetical protein
VPKAVLFLDPTVLAYRLSQETFLAFLIGTFVPFRLVWSGLVLEAAVDTIASNHGRAKAEAIGAELAAQIEAMSWAPRGPLPRYPLVDHVLAAVRASDAQTLVTWAPWEYRPSDDFDIATPDALFAGYLVTPGTRYAFKQRLRECWAGAAAAAAQQSFPLSWPLISVR